MLIKRLLAISIFILSSSLGLYVNAQELNQQTCCVKLFNGEFLPLTCGQHLGGSVLTLEERMMMGWPPAMCQMIPPSMSMFPRMGPMFPMGPMFIPMGLPPMGPLFLPMG